MKKGEDKTKPKVFHYNHDAVLEYLIRSTNSIEEAFVALSHKANSLRTKTTEKRKKLSKKRRGARIEENATEEEKGTAVVRCIICEEEFKMDDIYDFSSYLGVPSCHVYCYECIRGWISVRIDSGQPLSCPAIDCEHVFAQEDLQHMKLSLEMIEKAASRNLNAAMDLMGAVNCPYPDCSGKGIPKQFLHSECICCSTCGYKYCSLCRETFHYNTTCAEYKKTVKAWRAWCASGRKSYHDSNVAMKEKLKKDVELYEYHLSILEKYNAEQKRAYSERLGDEIYKSRHCKTCPYCRRVIEHIGGCSYMICGSDTHGGNLQNGCGRTFQWSSAKRYVCDAEPLREAFPESKPYLNIEKEEHVGYSCDMCKERIFGIRFCCENCSSFSLCEVCEIRFLEHSKDHVFRIVGARVTPVY